MFGAAAPALLAAEVEALGEHLSGGLDRGEVVVFGGLSYFCFEASMVTSLDTFILSNLALARGLFEVVDGGALRPVELQPLEFFASDVVTIQRYVGKTNEQFTHLLVNLGLAASRSADARAASGERVSLLDPVSGRGSTLNRGLAYGFHVAGVEVEQANVEQCRGFLSTYLKEHRVKHKVSSERVRNGPLAGTSAFEIAIRPASDAHCQHVRVVRASTEQCPQLFPGKRFDLIVGDLPYGVHHSSKRGSGSPRSGPKAATSSRQRAGGGRVESTTGVRSPEQLVATSITRWRQVMAKGASLTLSWNVQTLSRERLGNLLTDAGFDVVIHPRSFEHVVDRQITRDLIVGRVDAV